MALIPIAKKDWAYTLYKSEDNYILSVVCGDVAIYELNIQLNDYEINRYMENQEYLEEIASEITTNPRKYSPRGIILEI